MTTLSLNLFGSVRVLLDGQPAPSLPTKKVEAMLYYLAAEPAVEHRREALMTLLWPGMPERSARHNLRQTLYHLRKGIPEVERIQVDDQGKATKPVSLLLSNRQDIGIHPEAAVQVDVSDFEMFISRTKNHDHVGLVSCRQCQNDLRQAIELYRGDFLAGFYLEDSNEFEEWSETRREYYRRRALDALEILATISTRHKAYADARSYVEKQLDIDNLRESAYRQLMEVLALSGRREEALGVYENCRRLLAEELVMEPAAHTTQVYEKILAGDLSLDAPLVQDLKGYELKDVIGEGSYGTIRMAIQPLVDREVAVKVIRRRYANNPEFIRRFEAEAQTIARLEHPYIVPLYDYWRDPEGAYLVMRYMRGGSLLTALQLGPWDVAPAMKMMDQVTGALATAHKQGIIHRDIKPANILLDEVGNAYLSDFGIAKSLNGDMQFTADGALAGTPEYISPEQILDQPVTPRTDIYSLGAVLYETLTGEKLYADSSMANLIYKHLNEPVPLVSTSRPDLPAQIDDVIQRATAKRPEDRYADALEMAEAFRLSLRAPQFHPAGEESALDRPFAVPEILISNPYKGLRAFQETDASNFFGRESLVDQMLSRLAESRFLAVVGPSGSGKSSVVKAGLIPALREGAFPAKANQAGSDKWFVAEMVPGTHPFEELELALWSIAVDPPPSLVEPMQQDTRGMLRTIRRVLPNEEGVQLLLIIDQLEELFTMVDDEEQRLFFIDSLLAALRAPRTPLRVVVTLRADFYDRPLQMQPLGRLLKANTEIVLPMAPEELTWAVREPARRTGVKLEEGLAEVIVADVADQPGSLPLMQYALTELFERRQGRLMTREAYQEIGAVMGALGRRAEELYGNLNQDEQEATRQLFLRLVTLGEGVEDTRRRVLRSELSDLATPRSTSNDQQLESNDREPDHSQQPPAPIDNAQLSSVIDHFGAARLLTFDRDPVTRGATVEVAHEALLREWMRLRSWLSESRDDIRLQQRLARAAGEWVAADQDESYLLHGARLAQFEGWSKAGGIALTGEESAFLAASIDARQARQVIEEERRQQELETARKLAETEKARAETESQRAEEQANAARRLRQRAYMLLGVLIVAVILAVVAALFGGDANRKALVARSRELAAASTLNQESDPELSLLLAAQAFSAAETSEAEQALHSALLASRVRQRLVGHEAAIQRVAYSPDGQHIALFAAGEDLATIWDAESGQLLHEIPTDRCCWGLYFDDEGQRLTTAESGPNFGLAIWDVESGEKLESLSLPIPNSAISSYYLNPDWTRAVVFLRDETLAVWDLQKSVQLFDLPGHSGLVEMEYSKDGTRLVTYDNPNGLVLVWDAETGDLLRRLETGEYVNDHAVSPDGRRVALAVDNESDGWHVQIWDIDAPPGAEGDSPSKILLGHRNVIRLIDFSADGQMVASAGGDGTAKVWDTFTGETLLVLPHGVHVRTVGFHPDGHSLLSGDLNGVARVWDITPQGSSERLGLVANLGPTYNVDISPDGSTLATGGIARLWDLETGALRQSLVGHREVVFDVVFQPDGKRLATASPDGTARVWDTATGEQLLKLEGHGEALFPFHIPGVVSVDYHPDGKRLATAGADGTARIWDSRSGEELMVLEGHTANVIQVAFSPDGNYVATVQGSETNLNVEDFPITVRIWDVETGQQLFSFDSDHVERSWGLVFSPDGRFLVTGGNDATVRIWALDFEAGHAELIETLTNHANRVLGVRFSPDGRTLVTATSEEFRLWDTTSLVDGTDEISIVERLVLPGGPALAFTPDGTELITGGDDGLIRVYLLDNRELMELAESRMTRPLTEAECRQFLHLEACPEP